uniref:uncharacterized protein LOC105352929 n=1 Tax=Fragaria vesca subsp. vesca TaxID=101020 RepID=UPI0005CAD735|nr:PREDICTED: uncharacterized protein LOC105352929 [Fragaria vesca subsp. vesca]
MFLRKHIDPTLRRQYQSKHDPKDLRDALAERFGNIHSTLLPELIARWDEIRLLDYKKVDDFNRDMLCLQAQLSSCGVEKSDADMIEKTFSTFPSAAKILMNQYRLEFTNKRIATFSGLMTQLLMEEKNNMINDQHNLRPVGTRKIPESNYNCNRNKKAPKRKDQHRNETPVPPAPRAAPLLLGSSMLALLLPLMVNATDVGPRTTGLKAVALLQMLLPHTRNTRN